MQIFLKAKSLPRSSVQDGYYWGYQLKANKGFTLVEMLIYMAIIGLVVVGFVNFSLSISSSRDKTYVVQEVQANSRLAFNLISQKIKLSTGVNTTTSTFLTDPGVLSLVMASSTINPTIINLDQDDGILQITEGVADPIAITSNEVKVTNLVFTNLTSDDNRENIKINFTIEYQGDSAEYNYSQDVQTSVTSRQ